MRKGQVTFMSLLCQLAVLGVMVAQPDPTPSPPTNGDSAAADAQDKSQDGDGPKRALQAASDACFERARELFGPFPEGTLPTADGSGARTITKPRKVRQVAPKWPEPQSPRWACRDFAVQALIGPAGDVREVWPIRESEEEEPCPANEEAAVEAVRQWKYTPTLVGETAVPVCMSVRFHIDLR